MHHRITKTCQARRTRRAERLRELLQLSPADDILMDILLDTCARKSAADVKLLLQGMPSVNPDTVRDRHLRTPLHIACGRKDDFQEATAVARALLRAGADVNNGVGDVDGLQPMHMAVLAGNIQCVLMLLEEGASIPASDPFRLTPLLLAKLKMDNLRRTHWIKRGFEDDEDAPRISDALKEYKDLQSITEVLVTHLANKHITTYGPSRDLADDDHHGLSDCLFAKDDKPSDQQLNQTINHITEQLSGICVRDENVQLNDAMNLLMEKVRQLGLEETAVK
ncbi:hypothetical protein BCR43DRAFT_493973 [Syncephalastrum racemosum]|uniref:Uncharacterized protein n=1 Tax=Syncephalastrum racemosum TaxID=13706 RepID=A0A1X2H788_SYNRA|nr:hypothetical protein BCR43DRAFT_493973 [Syncephalastrum racemosum]